MVAFAAMLTEEALAAQAPPPQQYEQTPSWVSRTWGSSLVRNSDKNVPISAPNYWLLQISVAHANNSQDRDITAIYEKTITFTGKLEWSSGTRQNRGDDVKGSLTSANVNEFTNLWPGRSQTLNYYMSIGDFITPTPTWGWEGVNRQLAQFNGDVSKLFSDRKLVYGFHVRSRRSQ